MTTLIWTGPFRIGDLLAACLEDNQAWPPADNGVYLVSRKSWQGVPTKACSPLYFGGNTGRSARFCTRIGDLIADMYGFWDGNTGHHSGGQRLYEWCEQEGVHPGRLYLAWATYESTCNRCAEVELAQLLIESWGERGTLLNKKRPPRCGEHGWTRRA